MGRRHLEVVRSLGFEVVGICDSEPKALQAICDDYGVAPDICFRNPELLLENKLLQCVIVSTTAPTHCRFTCMAAEAEVPFIVCEKPMAVSLAECDQMIESCLRHGTRLAINHQMRFMQQYVEPKKIIGSPEFGGLGSVTVLAGNFGLAMNGTHYFEMFRFITDDEPWEVTGWFSNERVLNPRGPQFEDRAGCVRIVTKTGIRFYLDASSDQGHGFMAIYAGRFAQMVVDEANGHIYLSTRDEAHRVEPTTRYLSPFSVATRSIQPADAVSPTRSVLQALLDGGDYPTGEQGRLALHVLVAAHLSHELGGSPVKLTDHRIRRDQIFNWA
jgi:predicted dehydrogenase